MILFSRFQPTCAMRRGFKSPADLRTNRSILGGETTCQPILLQVSQWRETEFLRRYSIASEDIGKNPVSEIVKAASL
ncbi:MAG: hypothetical protein EAZ60_07085 [Oscillatoriales cyanobacterium]|nr:MAG: hypothetical protein EAZ83_07925 [Oscillatoriales cyanobacterium]TAE97311.1 MAG: hypothetical protein EAZ79_11375 [Oscillatoriales cyanobacterium]TAF21550.1 MAG: hypothetical protein EAZ73_08445 [Oscillatoriales cyanobacterium]TAF37707.1 MAG: hypothetical protein EAZ69_06420 [Oscillatoriales cyanobacterium]TAF57413.1 MAG: hypothetical protein EAZ60_07085 [Oscillatoriales cyanobacterium]